MQLSRAEVFRRINDDPLFGSILHRGYSERQFLGGSPKDSALPGHVHDLTSRQRIYNPLTFRQQLPGFMTGGLFLLLAAGTTSVVAGAIAVAMGQLDLGRTLVGVGVLACVATVWRTKATSDYYIDTLNAEEQIKRQDAQQQIDAERKATTAA